MKQRCNQSLRSVTAEHVVDVISEVAFQISGDHALAPHESQLSRCAGYGLHVMQALG